LKDPISVDFGDAIKKVSKIKLKEPSGATMHRRTLPNPTRLMKGKRRRMRDTFLQNLLIDKALNLEQLT
jgi:hypothetical protein